MTSLLRALALSVGQLGDPAILRVLGKSALISLGIFVGLGVGLYFLLEAALQRYAGGDPQGFSALLAAAGILVAAWLLFRVVALFVLQFFADEVIQAVESRHYPHASASLRQVPLREELANSLRSLGRTIGFNLLALPLAAALLVTGVGTALVFWTVNALLLGREFQDMVWVRHRRSGNEIAPIGAVTRFALGGLVAAMLLVPFVNLLAPVLGAASATHLVRRGRNERLHA